MATATQRDAFVMYKDNIAPSISDTIAISGRPVDLTGAAVKFMMRLTESSTVKVNASAIIVAPATSGQVQYDWISGDTNVPGEYSYWWRVTKSGRDQDTPEVPLRIDEHAPGEAGVLTGEIAKLVKTYLPTTWNALSDPEVYGEALLERRINTAKFRLFGTVVQASLEATIYNDFVLDYAAKLATIRIIPAAVDFWSNRSLSVVTPQETVTYPDRVNSLWMLHKRLLGELIEDETLFLSFFKSPFVRAKGMGARVGNGSAGNNATPDPWDFGWRDSRLPFGIRNTPPISFDPWK
jgi:hypothetical protein